jgi:hypothetical protein
MYSPIRWRASARSKNTALVSKKLENSEATCAMFLAYYNFCWRTRKPEEGKCRLPAAMAAGVVDR